MEQPSITPEEIRMRIEHRDVLLDLRAVLASVSGKNVFKYLIKTLDVAELPEVGLTGELLIERVGSLRAGNSIFKLLSEANVEVAAALLAKVEKEKQDVLYAEIQEG